MLDLAWDLEEGAFTMRVGSGARVLATVVEAMRMPFVNNKYFL